MILRPYQKLAVDFKFQHERVNFHLPMGMGKTVSCLQFLKEGYILEQDCFPVLVLGPLRVITKTWPDELKLWNFDFKYSVITGTQEERLKAMRAKADVFFMNYENIPWLVKLYEKSWPFKMVIADESTKLKNFRLRQGGLRARSLAKVAFKAKHWINLTGTPVAGGLHNLWGQCWFIDKGAALGYSYSRFTDTWFKSSYDGYGIEPMPHALSGIAEAIRPYTFTLKAEDWFDLQKPIVSRVMCQLPANARKMYKQMTKELALQTKEKLVTAANAAVKTMKLMQLTGGAIYDEQKQVHEIHEEKIEALKSIIEENDGAPIIVAYQFKHELSRLQKVFKNARVLDKSPRVQDDWNAGRISILLAHPKSAGHGLNLQHGGNILVYYSINWSIEDHQQIQERIGAVRKAQSGDAKPIYIYYILAEDTIDLDVLDRLEGRKSLEEAFNNVLKRG